jgi:hypothetical protein
MVVSPAGKPPPNTDWARYMLTEEVTVVLRKASPDSSLGMTLAKYPDDVPHPRVFDLSPVGLGAKSGLLRPKDVIVSVNGQFVDSDVTAAHAIQRAGLEITLLLRRVPGQAAPSAPTESFEPRTPPQASYPLNLALASPPGSPEGRSTAGIGAPCIGVRTPGRASPPTASSVSNASPPEREGGGQPGLVVGEPMRKPPPGPPPGEPGWTDDAFEAASLDPNSPLSALKKDDSSYLKAMLVMEAKAAAADGNTGAAGETAAARAAAARAAAARAAATGGAVPSPSKPDGKADANGALAMALAAASEVQERASSLVATLSAREKSPPKKEAETDKAMVVEREGIWGAPQPSLAWHRIPACVRTGETVPAAQARLQRQAKGQAVRSLSHSRSAPPPAAPRTRSARLLARAQPPPAPHQVRSRFPRRPCRPRRR